MEELIAERCARICGEEIKECFVSNERQVACIADMVINKTSGVLMMLGMSLREEDRGRVEINLGKARAAAEDLVNWVKFLQLTHDLKKLTVLSYEGGSEKRSETRYPVPESFGRYMSLEVTVGGVLEPAQMVNFSRGGLQFRCASPLEEGSSVECVLSTRHTIKKDVHFMARVKYVRGREGTYTVGGQIEAVSDSGTFDFFKDVYDFMHAIGSYEL